jgi:hypothetical protein
MKLKFKNQDFQTDVVVDLVSGQEKNQVIFSFAQDANPTPFNEFGGGNAMLIDNKQLRANIAKDGNKKVFHKIITVKPGVVI